MIMTDPKKAKNFSRMVTALGYKVNGLGFGVYFQVYKN